MTGPAEQEQVLDEVRSAERSRQDVVNVPSYDLEIPRDRSSEHSPHLAVLANTLPDHHRPVVRTRLPDPRLLTAERRSPFERCLAPERSLTL